MTNDYQEEKRILRQALLNKKLVVFVGAGVSKGSGMPAWKEAVSQISKRLGMGEKCSPEDYIRIPQYYYNSRGPKEYKELARLVFRENEELSPNDCHRKIIALDTHTIITTNYDDLLEKAARERHEMVQTISRNKDLPYKTSEREIIKIHGDFDHDNFVLKEDDYLHYSRDFALIETYVKSLLAVNVILFVGYSFSDPDVQQIFAWVKDVLQDDFQRAYMFEVGKSFSVLESEYYKNLGINVLYAKEMKGYSSRSYTDRLCAFLDELTNTDKEDNMLEVLEQNCLPFVELNFLRREQIESIFSGFIQYPDHNTHVLYADSSPTMLKKRLIKSMKQDDSPLRKCLENSSVDSLLIRSMSSQKSEKIPITKKDTKNSEILNSVVQFDHVGLMKARDNNECELSENAPERYLEQAYISFWLKDYLRAYSYLKISSQLYYDSKKYTWYFISEFNRRNVANEIIRKLPADEKVATRIKEEMISINLDIIFARIPKSSLVSKDLLKDIYTERMYYSSFKDVYKKGREVENEIKTTYITKSRPSFDEMRETVKECFCFEHMNHIILDRNIEIYQMFAEKIILSSISSDIVRKSMTFDSVIAQNVHSACLDIFDLQIIFLYYPISKLKEFFNAIYHRRILLSNEAKDYYLLCCENSVANEYIDDEYAWRMICLAGLVDADESISLAVLKLVEQRFRSVEHLLDYWNIVFKVLRSFSEQKVFENESCRTQMLKMIDHVICFKIEENRELNQRINNALISMLEILKNANYPCYTKTLKDYAAKDDYLLLSEIYTFVDPRIKNIISRNLKHWRWNSQQEDVQIYTHMVLSEIIAKDSDVESDIIKMICESKSFPKNRRIGQDNVTIQNQLLTLYLNDKLVRKKEAEEILKSSKDEFNVWILQIDKYDYDKFEVEWLLICSPSLLKFIANNPIAKRAICKKVKQVYFSQVKIDDKVIELFFKYFV